MCMLCIVIRAEFPCFLVVNTHHAQRIRNRHLSILAAIHSVHLVDASAGIAPYVHHAVMYSRSLWGEELHIQLDK